MQHYWEFNQTFYRFINILWKFFQANFYFWLCNPLLLLLLLFVKTEALLAALWLLIVPLMLTGPALAALFSVMDKLTRELHFPIHKHFFEAYRVHFRRSLLVWSLQVIILSTLVTDIHFFKIHAWGHYLLPLIFVPLLLAILMGFYLLPLVIKLNSGPKSVFKLAFYYTLKQWQTTFLLAGVTLALLAAYYTFSYLPCVSLSVWFFMSSLLAYLTMWRLQNLPVRNQITK